MNKEINKTLYNIGLTKDETAIYLAGLELGENSVQNIAKKAGIKRPTAYLILNDLIEKGLFYQIFKGKKRFFAAQDPKNLETGLKNKISELDKIMPELNSIYNVSETKPRVKFYEGLAGALAVYNDMLDSTAENGEMLSFGGIKNFYDFFPKDFAADYFARRVKKNIRPKIIALDSPESRQWQKDSEKELRDILLIPEGQFDFSGDIEIYGDKIALISYKENFMTIVIESKEIANMQRMMFRMLWGALDKKSNLQLIVDSKLSTIMV